jgi:hypothetical protein
VKNLVELLVKHSLKYCRVRPGVNP